MAIERKQQGTDQSANTTQRVDASRGGTQHAQSHSGVPAMTDGQAGNAVYDPAEQTLREDIPRAQQASYGELHRGNLPAHGHKADPVPHAGERPKDLEDQGERRAGS